MDLLGYSISILILVLLSAFFSGAETAYSSINRVKFKAMADSKKLREKCASALGQNFDKLISTILIGNNIVNIGSATLATLLFAKLLNDYTLGGTVSTIVATIVVLFIGEVAPKTITKKNPEPFAIFTAPFILVLYYLFYPLNIVLGGWQKICKKLFKVKDSSQITDEDLLTFVDEAKNSGEIDKEESELIKSAIEFDDLIVEDALTPRVIVESIELNTSMEKILAKFEESGYSRLPVYRGSEDNIVGILNEKDFYKAYLSGEKKIKNVMSKNVIMVPTSMQLSVLLKKLQKGKMHMAVVISEFGGIRGIITLEDILEELVGEIWDEHDDINEPVKKLKDDEFEVSGDYGLDDFFELFEIDQDADDYDPVKLSGFIVQLLGTAPKVGDEVDFENLHISVEKVEFNRMTLANVKVLEKKEKKSENNILLRGLVGNNDEDEAEE